MADMDRRVFGGRYELVYHIARGGMAEVYRAQDNLLGRPVALKVLFPELSVDRSFVERFRREAQAAANLSHPNIVPVFDWGEDLGTYYIVMEFIDGRPLSALLRNMGTLPAERAAIIAADVAAALTYAHRHGVVHRDVKPGNILLTDDNVVKVTDFGIAGAMNTSESLTQTGAVMGPATYFSPEQAQGYGVDGRSDLYSLGVVLYEMVVGRPPFLGDTPVAVASKHVREMPTPPRELDPAVPVDLESVIMTALAKSPADRYQNAEAMQADLHRFVQGHAVQGAGTAVRTTGASSVGSQVTRAFGGGTSATATAVLPHLGTLGGPPGQDATQVFTDLPANGALPPGPPGPGMPGDDDAKERRKTWLYVAVLIVLLAALGVMVYLLGKSLGYFKSAPASFSMPSVASATEHRALLILEGDDLKVRVAYQASSVTKGDVISTSPPSGTSVTKGETVTLDVSSGPAKSKAVTSSKVRVPGVEGDALNAAEQALGSVGLHWKIQYESTTSVTAGDVVSQSPTAGDNLTAGAAVTLVVAKAPSPPAEIAVPNVTGLTPAKAGAVLGQAGFTVGSTVDQASSTISSGYVIGTEPPTGTDEPPTTTINLVVSTGPSQVLVASVVGDTQSQAVSTLDGEGLSAVVVCESTLTPSQVGYVISQSPTGGTSVAAGSSVTIDVGENPVSGGGGPGSGSGSSGGGSGSGPGSGSGSSGGGSGSGSGSGGSGSSGSGSGSSIC